jgi:phage baseplate assembly protein gpV
MKINFGNENSALPADEYILDSGQGYSADRGYGWVTQDSLDNSTPTPIDITANTRDRDSIDDQATDTLIHLQYPEGLPGIAGGETPVTTPSAWEYDLANGTYQVTVSVGDPDFTDSNHVINIEGESAISGFQPTSDNLFSEVTTVVEVTDGKLTLDAIGGENTKLNFVEIATEDGTDLGTDSGTTGSGDGTSSDNGDGTDTSLDGGTGDGSTSGDGASSFTDSANPVQAVDGGINFNFGTGGGDAPSGFTQETGAAYDADRGYGWVTQDSAGTENLTPIDLSANGRDRDTLFTDADGNQFQDPARDSLIHLQYPTGTEVLNATAELAPAAWEYDLANGQYEVTVGVGDSDFSDSNHVINVEGESLIAGFTPIAGAQEFTEGSSIVDVNDGRLTIDAIGGDNTKINYISIVPVG